MKREMMMKAAFMRFMSGRYGQQGLDSFGFFLVIMVLVLAGSPFVWIASPLVVVWEVFRLLSRNTAGRLSEELHFRKITSVVAGWLSPIWRIIAKTAAYAAGFIWRFIRDAKVKYRQARIRIRERKTHMFIHCPQCRNVLRLPRGKGRLSVTCPVCRKTFLKST
jgi:hypothetical protein